VTSPRHGPTMGHLDPAGPDHTDIRHVCFACGGPLAANHGALIVVRSCWACGGRGTLTDDELSVALGLDEHRSRNGLT
jgi:hypothetical protein